MKRFFIITILASIAITSGLAGVPQNRPDMAHQSTGKDRLEIFGTLATPDVDLFGDALIITNAKNGTFYISNYSSTKEYLDYVHIDTNEYTYSLAGYEDTKYIVTVVTDSGATYKWTLDLESSTVILCYHFVPLDIDPGSSSNSRWDNYFNF